MRHEGSDPSRKSAVAVFDVGKTNVKLSMVSPEGSIVETRSLPNATVDDPHWRRHDLVGTETWLLTTLAEFATRFELLAFVTSGHGSAGVLVREAELSSEAPALPMIDYEQALPEDIRAAYAPQAGGFFDRGSAVMLGATHQARQMFWIETKAKSDFDQADWFLGVPQYWAWRLCGVAASEVTYLGAQSHLWNVPAAHWSEIVGRRGWRRLMPPFHPAWDRLGRIRPELAHRYELPPDLPILTGIHDSSANFYRYQTAGLSRMTVVSTGTWIVALSDHADLAALNEARGMTCNADVYGRPLGGALTMAGREFAAIAGEGAANAKSSTEILRELVAQGTMALPSFGRDDGLFPGSAGRGHIVGSLPKNADERLTLAVLYAALLTNECLEALSSKDLVILDGTFLREPLYASLVGALRPECKTAYNLDSSGVASGAALLATHGMPDKVSPVTLKDPEPFQCPALPEYAREWRSRVTSEQHRFQPT
jgi:sugar (pentulose or hexulose) kinase